MIHLRFPPKNVMYTKSGQQLHVAE